MCDRPIADGTDRWSHLFIRFLGQVLFSRRSLVGRGKRVKADIGRPGWPSGEERRASPRYPYPRPTPISQGPGRGPGSAGDVTCEPQRPAPALRNEEKVGECQAANRRVGSRLVPARAEYPGSVPAGNGSVGCPHGCPPATTSFPVPLPHLSCTTHSIPVVGASYVHSESLGDKCTFALNVAVRLSCVDCGLDQLLASRTLRRPLPRTGPARRAAWL